MITRYPGGKGADGVYQRIISQMPPHACYIEPFLGGGSIMRLKLPARHNIGLDLDRVILGRVARQIQGAGPKEIPLIEPQRLALPLGVGQAEIVSTIGKNGDASWWEFIEADALAWLAAYRFRGDELVYADPPYLMSSRRQQAPLYPWEFGSPDQHLALLSLLRRLPCRVMLSAYPSDLYTAALTGWRALEYTVVTRSSLMADEVLWMNYPAPLRLHDYRFLGANFRERERIKRKRSRWAARLAKMDSLERQALVMALEEIA